MNISLNIQVFATYHIKDTKDNKMIHYTCYDTDDVKKIIKYFRTHKNSELVNITYSDSWLKNDWSVKDYE